MSGASATNVTRRPRAGNVWDIQGPGASTDIYFMAFHPSLLMRSGSAEA